MQIIFNNRELEGSRLKIVIDGDTEFNLQIDRFGELIIQKISFDSGSSSINISPKVSNEIGIR